MHKDNDTNVGPGKLRLFSEFSEMAVSLITLFMVVTGNKHVAEAKTEKEKREIAQQQFPRMFGWGKADEQIYATLLAVLTPEEVKALSALTAMLNDQECEDFRVIVTGIRTETEKGDEKHRVNIEFTDGDNRVKFLQKLSKQIIDGGVEPAIKMLRDNKFVGGVSSSAKAKSFAAKFLGLANIEDLADPAKVAETINVNIRPKIQAKRKNVFKRNILGKIFQI